MQEPPRESPEDGLWDLACSWPAHGKAPWMLRDSANDQLASGRY